VLRGDKLFADLGSAAMRSQSNAMLWHILRGGARKFHNNDDCACHKESVSMARIIVQ